MKKTYMRNRYIFILDILSVIMATWLTYFTVFTDMALTEEVVFFTAGMYAACTLLVFSIFRVYTTAWCYSGTSELMKFLLINAVAVVMVFVVNETLRLTGVIHFAHRRINFVIAVLSILSMTIVRMFAKEFHKAMGSRVNKHNPSAGESAHRVLIIGAGDAGRIIINNSKANADSNIEVVGFIDDDRAKVGKTFFGVKVLGGRYDIVRICEQMDVDRIILAIPTAYAEERREIIDICSQTKCSIKTIPGISELVDAPKKKI